MNRWLYVLAALVFTGGIAHSMGAQGPAPSVPARTNILQLPENHGDEYPIQGGIRRLLRIPGKLAITVKPGRDENTVINGLLKRGAALENYRIHHPVGKGTLIVRTTDDTTGQARLPATGSQRSKVAANADVLSCNPVFIDTDSGQEIVLTTEIIVRLKPDVDPTSYFGADWSRVRPLAGNTGPEYILTLTNATAEAVLAAVAHQASHPEVEWAEPVMLSPLVKDFMPDDALFASQWHHDHIGQNETTTNADIRSPQAWDITPGGSSNIVIAIIDDGVQRSHPDLAANIFFNTGDSSANGIDGDGNGYIDDHYGWDFANGDNEPTPTGDDHGTACAGMAAAVGNNGTGVVGSAFNCKILPVKISETNVWLNSANLALAIRYAAGIDGAGNTIWRGADVLSMSWNYGSNAAGSSALADAFSKGRNGRGCVLFGSSGNNGSGYAGFRTVTSNYPAGNYFVQFEYYKDAATASGSDTVWLAGIQLPDANHTREFFDSPGLPAGWTVGGTAPFFMENNPEYSYGTGRYQVRSGAIGDGQISWIRTPTFTLTPGTDLNFKAWVDTEAGFAAWTYPPVANEGDWLYVRFYSVTAGSWYTNMAYEAGTPGNHRNLNDTAVATTPHWPSVHSNVIGVGGCTDMGYRYDGSQYRLTGLEFVAPTAGGVEGVWSTDRTGANGYNTTAGTNGNYTAFSGTSAACPLTAGIGALLLSVNSNLSPVQVLQRMRDSCTKIGNVTYVNGTNFFYGHGRVNAYHALLTNSMPSVAVVSNDVVRNQRTYYARDTIETAATFAVMPGADVTFRSGQKVDLVDFHAHTGSLYQTVIDPALQ